jgi:hypothetical protein
MPCSGIGTKAINLRGPCRDRFRKEGSPPGIGGSTLPFPLDPAYPLFREEAPALRREERFSLEDGPD